MSEYACQREVVGFLSDPSTYFPEPESVQCIQTHGALVFLAGNVVYKIKRAVKYPYMDFSTLEKREFACRRELAINKPNAPQIYLDVVPIVRTAGGRLRFGGAGTVLEWAVHMRRFDSDALLADYASKSRLTDQLAQDVARAIVRFHCSLVSVDGLDAGKRMANVVAGVASSLLSLQVKAVMPAATRLNTLLNHRFIQALATLEQRGRLGFVVRGHGDLHLANIAIIDNCPVLFDALEFDEDLATVDVLYDLAFLLMDLEFSGLRNYANLILNRYLFDSDHQENYSGLNAMPFFLGLRASVRGMVTLQRSQLQSGGARVAAISLGKRYLQHAINSLQPPGAELVAIGGLSGTGKSTQARAVAPDIGASPGAVHLRSDLERKRLSGAQETDRLPPESYAETTGEQVYGAMLDKAHMALRAGHSVVLDATFLQPAHRAQALALAQTCNVPFCGIWLTAPANQLRSRVAARRDDASDATVQVLDRQLASDSGSNTWQPVDASGDGAQVQINLRRVLSLSAGMRLHRS